MSKPRAKKDWKCQDCGKRMTLRQAERMEGCAGCGAGPLDVEYDPEPSKKAEVTS